MQGRVLRGLRLYWFCVSSLSVQRLSSSTIFSEARIAAIKNGVMSFALRASAFNCLKLSRSPFVEARELGAGCLFISFDRSFQCFSIAVLIFLSEEVELIRISVALDLVKQSVEECADLLGAALVFFDIAGDIYCLIAPVFCQAAVCCVLLHAHPCTLGSRVQIHCLQDSLACAYVIGPPSVGLGLGLYHARRDVQQGVGYVLHIVVQALAHALHQICILIGCCENGIFRSLQTILA